MSGRGDATRKYARPLLGFNEIIVVNSVVTKEEQSILVRWAERNFRAGKMLNNPRDSASYSTPYLSAGARTLTELTQIAGPLQKLNQDLVWTPQPNRPIDPLPEEFWDIRRRVIALIGLSDLIEDPYKGSFLNYIVPGGRVHQHRDDRIRVGEDEFDIIRCNVFFRRPKQGGLPIIAQREIEVPDLGMWVFYATELVHGANEVGGEEARGTLSFGFSVRHSDHWHRRFWVTTMLQSSPDLNIDSSPEIVIDKLTKRAISGQISEQRLEILTCILSQKDAFSPWQIAEDVGQSPSEAWQVIRQLQSASLVTSESSINISCGEIKFV
jgi:hypothetical protein